MTLAVSWASFPRKVNQEDPETQASLDTKEAQAFQDLKDLKDQSDQEVFQAHLVQRETRVTGCLSKARRGRRVRLVFEGHPVPQGQQTSKQAPSPSPSLAQREAKDPEERKAIKVIVSHMPTM